MNKKLLIKVLLLRRLRKRLKRKKREVGIRPLFLKRLEYGENIILKELREDDQYHHRYFRMTKESFDEILMAIKPQITRKRTHCRPISPQEKLAATLRYLATGNSQVSIAFSTRISPSSISNILREVMTEICNALGPQYLPSPSLEMWKEAEEGFSKKWHFPNCVGSLDGKHVRIVAPAQSGSSDHNYKMYFSKVLLAIVGPNYEFLCVDIGASGSQSDGGIFMRSAMGERLEKETLYIPPVKEVGNVPLPHVIVGDDAFPLKKYLMKPYPGDRDRKDLLPLDKRIFNYRLSRARMVVECAFGIFAGRWRIFHVAINADEDLIKLIIRTCVILHNFLLAKKDMTRLPPKIRQEIEAESNKKVLQSCSVQGSHNFTDNAGKIRNEFCRYFSNEGAVEFQMERVDQ